MDQARERGRRIREARLRRSLTQYDLAELVGVRVIAISRIERGTTKRPRQETLEGIARALGVDLRTLGGNDANSHRQA